MKKIADVVDIADKIWKLTEKFCKQAQSDDPNILFATDKYDSYKEHFIELNKMILDEYMKAEVKNLDRHKIAGIAMISLLDSDAIQYKGELNENRFFGKYTIAASVAISYMQDIFNNMLKVFGRNPIQKIEFPKAFSCNTDYFEIFCRNIQFAYEKKKWGVNPLDISEKLFMLEYITLLENKIPIDLFSPRETCKEGQTDENVGDNGTTI